VSFFVLFGMVCIWLCQTCPIVSIDLGELQTKGARAKVLDQAISYFGNHQDRMGDSLHVAMDLPIGSGVTEAGCKIVVKQRMCGSGMKWQMPGAKQILSLRTMVLTNGRWEQFWQKLSQFGFTKISGPAEA